MARKTVKNKVGRIPDADPNAPLLPDDESGEPFIVDPKDPEIRKLLAAGMTMAQLQKIAAKYAPDAEDEIEPDPVLPGKKTKKRE